MTARWVARAVVCAAAAGFAGCGPPGKVKEEEITIQQQKALPRARQLLENYAKGQPLGSEVTSYDALVAEVKQEDPDKGAVLEQGLKELQQPRADTRAKAREILAKLAPQQR